MKTKEYIESIKSEFNHIIPMLQRKEGSIDHIEVDKELVRDLLEFLELPDDAVLTYRGVRVSLKTDTEWTSSYNFIAYRNGVRVYQNYTLLG